MISIKSDSCWQCIYSYGFFPVGYNSLSKDFLFLNNLHKKYYSSISQLIENVSLVENLINDSINLSVISESSLISFNFSKEILSKQD